jgi:hypothetical protein
VNGKYMGSTLSTIQLAPGERNTGPRRQRLTKGECQPKTNDSSRPALAGNRITEGSRKHRSP